MSPSTANPTPSAPLAVNRQRDVSVATGQAIEMTVHQDAATRQPGVVETAETTGWRPKQIHPIELTFLCTSARCIRLRGG